jgi:hypothetical protein
MYLKGWVFLREDPQEDQKGERLHDQAPLPTGHFPLL